MGQAKLREKVRLCAASECGLCLSFPCTRRCQCQQWELAVTPGLLLDTEGTPGTEQAQGMLVDSLGPSVTTLLIPNTDLSTYTRAGSCFP